MRVRDRGSGSRATRTTMSEERRRERTAQRDEGERPDRLDPDLDPQVAAAPDQAEQPEEEPVRAVAAGRHRRSLRAGWPTALIQRDALRPCGSRPLPSREAGRSVRPATLGFAPRGRSRTGGLLPPGRHCFGCARRGHGTDKGPCPDVFSGPLWLRVCSSRSHPERAGRDKAPAGPTPPRPLEGFAQSPSVS